MFKDLSYIPNTKKEKNCVLVITHPLGNTDSTMTVSLLEVVVGRDKCLEAGTVVGLGLQYLRIGYKMMNLSPISASNIHIPNEIILVFVFISRNLM